MEIRHNCLKLMSATWPHSSITASLMERLHDGTSVSSFPRNFSVIITRSQRVPSSIASSSGETSRLILSIDASANLHLLSKASSPARVSRSLSWLKLMFQYWLLPAMNWRTMSRQPRWKKRLVSSVSTKPRAIHSDKNQSELNNMMAKSRSDFISAFLVGGWVLGLTQAPKHLEELDNPRSSLRLIDYVDPAAIAGFVSDVPPKSFGLAMTGSKMGENGAQCRSGFASRSNQAQVQH